MIRCGVIDVDAYIVGAGTVQCMSVHFVGDQVAAVYTIDTRRR